MLGRGEVEGKGEGGNSAAKKAPRAAGGQTRPLQPHLHPRAWRAGLQLPFSLGTGRDQHGEESTEQEKQKVSKTQPRARRLYKKTRRGEGGG